MSKVAIIIPSRGLMFSRSAEDILRNAKDINHKIFFSHKRPIPECFEIPTNQALADESITHLLFVEDDMIIPDGTFWGMLAEDKPVVTCDYPVTKEGKGAVFYDPAKTVVFCGTGCLLVKREVFEKLKAPYFRTDVRWTPLNYGKTIKLVGVPNTDGGYGLHDVTFGIRLLKAGVPIHVYGKLGQRKLVELGKSGTNDGAHKIESWHKIKKDYQLKRIFSSPLATGAKGLLVTVDTPTGGVTVSQKHANNLIKQGLATPINNKNVIIDDSGVKL